MFHPDFDHYGLGKERMAQMRKEVQHNRLEAGLAREARSAKAASLGEEARLAKARLAEEAVPLLRKRGMLTRGRTFAAALFR
jgi:hypothetical protein